MSEALAMMMMMQMMNKDCKKECKTYRRKKKYKKQKKFYTTEQKIAYYNAQPYKWAKKLPYLIATGKATAQDTPTTYFSRKAQIATATTGGQSAVSMPMLGPSN